MGPFLVSAAPEAQRAHLVETAFSIYPAGRATVLSLEELLARAPKVELWKVDDAAVKQICVDRMSFDPRSPSYDLPVSVFAQGRLVLEAPARALTWVRVSVPMLPPIRIETTISELWLHMIYKYSRDKEPKA